MFELFWLALVAAENFDLDLNFNTITLEPGRVKGRQESLKENILNQNQFYSFTIIVYINLDFFQLKKVQKIRLRSLLWYSICSAPCWRFTMAPSSDNIKLGRRERLRSKGPRELVE